jgi:hypothetical protein
MSCLARRNDGPAIAASPMARSLQLSLSTALPVGMDALTRRTVNSLPLPLRRGGDQRRPEGDDLSERSIGTRRDETQGEGSRAVRRCTLYGGVVDRQISLKGRWLLL